MNIIESSKEIINGKEWHCVAIQSTDGRYYWRLYKNGYEHKLEIDSVPQKTPKAAIAMAHFFTEGINKGVESAKSQA